MLFTHVFRIRADLLALVVVSFVFLGCVDFEVSTAEGPLVFLSCTKRRRLSPCITLFRNATGWNPVDPN